MHVFKGVLYLLYSLNRTFQKNWLRWQSASSVCVRNGNKKTVKLEVEEAADGLVEAVAAAVGLAGVEVVAEEVEDLVAVVVDVVGVVVEVVEAAEEEATLIRLLHFRTL